MEKIIKQIDDIFDNIELLQDSDNEVTYGHINEKPIFAIYESIYGNVVIGFYRDISNILFYVVENSDTLKEYMIKKFEDIYDLLDYPIEELKDVYMFNFDASLNKEFLLNFEVLIHNNR